MLIRRNCRVSLQQQPDAHGPFETENGTTGQQKGKWNTARGMEVGLTVALSDTLCTEEGE